MIWTVKLMLDFLGHEKQGSIVMKAIEKTLENKNALTPDLGGKGSTASLGDEICKNII